MPRGPQKQWRPAGTAECAVHVMRIATGEIDETFGCNSHTDTAGSLPTAYRHDIVESRNLRLVGMCEQGPGSLEAIALHESSEG